MFVTCYTVPWSDRSVPITVPLQPQPQLIKRIRSYTAIILFKLGQIYKACIPKASCLLGHLGSTYWTRKIRTPSRTCGFPWQLGNWCGLPVGSPGGCGLLVDGFTSCWCFPWIFSLTESEKFCLSLYFADLLFYIFIHYTINILLNLSQDVL